MTDASEARSAGPALEGDIWLPIPDAVSPVPGLMVRVPTEEITFDLSDVVPYPEQDPDYWTNRYLNRVAWGASLWSSYRDPGKLVAVDTI